MIKKLVILLFVFSQLLFAAEKPFNWGNEENLVARMELLLDAQSAHPQGNVSASQSSEKSVKKAVLMSAVVPGSGQFYSKSYIKALFFLAVEAGAIAVNISYNKKGDDKDKEFKIFAGDHWSERAYWSYVAYKAADQFENVPIEKWQLEPSNNGNWQLIPENLYNDALIAELRELEGQMTEFSHRLPNTKTQQYYEMIGKYPAQFGNAWDDANFTTTYTGYPPKKLTSRNSYYMEMRDEANRFYNVAGYGTMTMFVNHVLAALDAGFTARRYNRKNAVNVNMSYNNILYKSEYVNLYGVNISW